MQLKPVRKGIHAARIFSVATHVNGKMAFIINKEPEESSFPKNAQGGFGWFVEKEVTLQTEPYLEGESGAHGGLEP